MSQTSLIIVVNVFIVINEILTAKSNEYDACSQCETGYGYDGDNDGLLSTCFSDFGFPAVNWGWSLGAYTCDDFADGSTELEMWISAGRCDLTNGEFGGNIYLDYSCDNNELIVSFDSESSMYVFDNIDLYVGNDPLPRNGNGMTTISPGLYPYSKEDGIKVESYTFETITIESPFYVIAHCDSCKCDNKAPSGEPTGKPIPGSKFVCDDGCQIPLPFYNDGGYCDCSNCEDEVSFTCETCLNGCPSNCNDFKKCTSPP